MRAGTRCAGAARAPEQASSVSRGAECAPECWRHCAPEQGAHTGAGGELLNCACARDGRRRTGKVWSDWH
eukprot:346629-Alexandrium_andersonii.AAC.1